MYIRTVCARVHITPDSVVQFARNIHLNAYPSFFPLIGYRYMGVKGLSVKTFIKLSYYTEDSWIDEWGQGKLGFGISIGYRFWL